MAENYVSRLLNRFEGVVPIDDSRWKALCPAHDDSTPSLSISLNNQGLMMVKCHANCDTQDVLAKVGLDFRSMYPPDGEEPILGLVEAAGGKKGKDRPLPEAKWHDLYSDFLAALTLQADDRERLRGRGLSDEAIDRNGYKTLNWMAAVKAANQLVKKYSKERVLLTPGFRVNVKSADGSVEPVLASGLLIPVRSLEGKVLGLKVRREGEPKYVWFSGGGSPSVGSPAHFSRGRQADVVRVVEGPLKADVVAHLEPHHSVIGIGGVQSWPGAMPVLEALKPQGVRLALDIDWKVNPGVSRALVGLLDALEGKFPTVVELWSETAGKGLDDVLLGDGRVVQETTQVVRAAAALVGGNAPAEKEEEEGEWALPQMATAGASAGSGLKMYRASDLGMSHITWLWEPWIPNGAIVLLEGDPAVGKGLLVSDLTARLTTGSPLPPGPRGAGDRAPSNVLIVSSEDSYRKVLNPRLTAAGADLKRVFYLWEVQDVGDKAPRMIVLPHDLDRIKEKVEQERIKLIVLDPLNAFLDPSIDANKDADVRSVLSKVFAWLETTDVAMLAIRHLNKDTSMKAVHRGVGSVAYTAQARVGLLVAEDPDDPNRRLLVQSKNNWAQKPKGLAYLLEQVSEIEGLDGPVKLARVEWAGEVDLVADDLTGGQTKEERTDREEARWVLEEMLKDGPRPTDDLQEACGQAGISRRTFFRVCKSLKVESQLVYLEGVGSKWFKALPGKTLDWDKDRLEALSKMMEVSNG